MDAGRELLRRHMAQAAYRVRKCALRDKPTEGRRCLDSIRLYLGMPRGRVDHDKR